MELNHYYPRLRRISYHWKNAQDHFPIWDNRRYGIRTRGDLNLLRKPLLQPAVEVTGFEPAISWSQTTRDSQTSLHFVIRDEAIFMFIKQSTFLQNNTPEAVYMGTIPSEFLRVQVMFSQSENYPVFILRIKTWQAATPCPHRPIIKSLIHFSRSFLHPTGACSVRLAGNAELKPQK